MSWWAKDTEATWMIFLSVEDSRFIVELHRSLSGHVWTMAGYSPCVRCGDREMKGQLSECFWNIGTSTLRFSSLRHIWTMPTVCAVGLERWELQKMKVLMFSVTRNGGKWGGQLSKYFRNVGISTQKPWKVSMERKLVAIGQLTWQE